MNIIKSFILTVATILVILALIVGFGITFQHYPIVFFIVTPILMFLMLWVFVSAVVDLVKENYNG